MPVINFSNKNLLNEKAINFGSGVVDLGRDESLYPEGDMTLSATFELNDLSSGNQRVLYNPYQYGIFINNDDLKIVLRTVDGELDYIHIDNAFTEPGWHDVQVVIDRDENSLEIWADGNVVHTDTAEQYEIAGPGAWYQTVTAGGTPFGQELNGQIADVSVSSEAVEIDANMDIVERMVAAQTGDQVNDEDAVPLEETPTGDAGDLAEDNITSLEGLAAKLGDGVVDLGRDESLYPSGDMTLSTTFSLDDLDGRNQRVFWSPGQYGMEISKDDVKVALRGADGKLDYLYFRDVLTEAGWHDFQITIDQSTSTLKIILDGVELHSGSSAGYEISGPGAWYQTLTLGGTPHGKHLEGSVADFSITDEVIDFTDDMSMLDRLEAVNPGAINQSDSEPDTIDSEEPVNDNDGGTVDPDDTTDNETPDDTGSDTDPVVDDPTTSNPDPDVEDPDTDTPTDPTNDDPSNDNPTDDNPTNDDPAPVGDPAKTIEISNAAELNSFLAGDVSGYTIVLAPGNYGDGNFSNLSPTDGLTITSADPSNPAQFDNANVFNSSNLTFTNLAFKSDDAPNASWGEIVVNVKNSSNLTFEDNLFSGNSSSDLRFYGLQVDDSDGVVVTGNEFANLARGGIYYTTSNLTVTNNDLHDIRSDGFDFRGVQDVLIDGNSFTDFYPVTGDHADAIQFWTNGAERASENVVISNNFLASAEGGQVQGIFLGNGDEIAYKNFTITNNVIYNDGAHGILIALVDGLEISDNTVLASPSAVWKTGITVVSATDAVVEDNITNHLTLNNNSNLTADGNIVAQHDDDVYAGNITDGSRQPEDFVISADANAGANVYQIQGAIDEGYVYGGSGSDTLDGSGGDKVFLYGDASDSAANGNWDTITNFDATDGDKISFEAMKLDSSDFTYIGNTAYSDQEYLDLFDGKPVASFDESTSILSVDTNGDNIIDMNIELIGVSQEDLDRSDFLI